MIIVSGYLRTAADDRDAYLAACRQVVEQARRAPGCLDFALSADPVEPDRVNVYERWESDEELERFRGSGPEPGAMPPLAGADVQRYRIAAVEPA